MSIDKIIVNDREFAISEDPDGVWPSACKYVVDELPGIEVEVVYEDDMDFCNPRRNFDHLGTMVTFGRSMSDYVLGDDQWREYSTGDEFEVECDRCNGEGFREFVFYDGELTGRTVQAECAKCNGRGYMETTIVPYVKYAHGAVIAMPIYINPGHGANNGFCNVDDSPDDATNGVLFVTQAELDEEFNRKGVNPDDACKIPGKNPPKTVREYVERNFQHQVEEYSNYLQGECFVVTVEDETTNTSEACGGYVGFNWTEKVVKEELHQTISRRLVEDIERVYWSERDVVTV